MEIRDYLLDEIKRLNRRNDILEKQANKSEFVNLGIEEAIQKNALAINEITKANNPLTEKILQQIDTYLGEKY